ncbi:helix-turn-helix domain-containing protein [Peptoniphilus sp. SGI.035]|uniref:helix-turn-helix domain-containing protein n=1 Tax=Peptoniphilus sp. SGI.035 TaxID=3420564 RepID=UPI003CFD82D6
MGNFQTRLRELRMKNNLSQLELSKILNISNVTLSQYENGVRKPDINTISEFADYFNVTTDYLLGRSSNPNQSIKTNSKAEELEEDFPEGISVLYRANKNLTPEQKEVMLRMIKASFFEEKDKDKDK